MFLVPWFGMESLLLGELSSLLSGTGFLLLVLCILLPLMISVRLGAWASVIFIELSLIFIIVSAISFMRLLFIVGMRPLGSGGIGFGRTLWCIPVSGSSPTYFLLLAFSSERIILRLVVLRCLLIRPGLMRNSERDTGLEEFALEVDGWLPLLPEVHLPRLTGQMLADVVRRKGATAGSLAGWRWRELKVLPVSWYDGLSRILTKVEEVGVWPDGLLDAYIALIPKSDGDATLFARGLAASSQSCIVFGLVLVWGSWRIGLSLGCLNLSSVLVVVVGRWKLGILLLLILRRFLLVPLILMFISLLLMSSSLSTRLTGGSWIGF